MMGRFKRFLRDLVFAFELAFLALVALIVVLYYYGSQTGHRGISMPPQLNQEDTAGYRPDKARPDEMIYFEAKLPKHGLKMESNMISVKPHIVVNSLKWDKQEARRGDTLKLTADFHSGVEDNPEAMVIIYEFSPEGHHFRVASIPTQVKSNRIELLWEFQFQDNTAEIPTEAERRKYGKHYVHPEFFFVVQIDDEKIGVEQESGKLKFQDWVGIELKDQDGRPSPGADYILHLPDGGERKGKLDKAGKALELDVPPGPTWVEFPDADGQAQE